MPTVSRIHYGVFFLVGSMATLSLLPLHGCTHSPAAANNSESVQGGKKSKDASLTPALIKAAQSCHVEEVKQLLAQGADINGQDAEGGTPLLWALEKCNMKEYGTETATFLLDAGANVNIMRKNGLSALILACNRGGVGMARKVLAKGADVNAYNTNVGNDPKPEDKGDTALIYEAMYSHADTIRFLLEHGADPRLQNGRGKTALDMIGFVKVSASSQLPEQSAWVARSNPTEARRLLLEAMTKPLKKH